MPEKAQQTDAQKKVMRDRQSGEQASENLIAWDPAADSLSLQRAMVDPAGAAPAAILALQHSAGNQAVNRLLQTKFATGAPRDRHEQAGGRPAEMVMTPEPASLLEGKKAPADTVQRLFGRKKKEAPTPTVSDEFFRASHEAWATGKVPEKFQVGPNEKAELEEQRKQTRVQVAFEGLSGELKGHTGFFRTKRKTQAAFESQGGVLQPHQVAWINTLAELAPDRLTGLGFLLPGAVKQWAQSKIDGFGDEAQTKDWEKRFSKLPIKQQMQISTYMGTMEVSRPEPAKGPESPKQGEAKGGSPVAVANTLAQEALKKRTEMGLGQGVGTSSSSPTQEPKTGARVPSSTEVVLQPGKGGEEKATHHVDGYRDIVADYVEQAGIDQATIGQTAEVLITDYVDVSEAGKRYRELAHEKEISEQMLGSQNTLPSKEKKQQEGRVKWASEGMGELIKALHEEDFDKATRDARSRAERSQTSFGAATQEKATVEYLYDEVEKKKEEVKKRKSDATRSQKKDPSFTSQTAQMEKDAADQARGLVQQAKMSFDVVRIHRRSTDETKTYVQKKLDRIAGTLRKIGGKIFAGALGAGVGFLTLGLVGVKEKTSAKGYMGEGLRKTGWPIKATFLNDIRNQLAQFRNTVRARPDGPSAIDVISAILRGFNEIVVQNVINIAGKLAVITGLLATLLTASAIVTLGGTAPVAAVLATISGIATFVALIAAALKAAVSLARVTMDGLAALLNQDAKLRNVLKSRAKQSGMETMSDVTQASTSAVGLPTGEAIKGNGFFNMFDPSQLVGMKVGALTAQSPGMVKTMLGTGTSTAMTVGGPLVMGPVAQGIKGAVDEPYSLSTQHTDELGMAPKTKAGGGFLPPSGQKGRLEAKSGVSKPEEAKVDRTMPKWMQNELDKQNKLRSDVYKGQTAVGVGQLSVVTSKSNQVADKLKVGKSESDKMDKQLKESKGKGNSQVDDESMEMSRQQSGVLDSSAGTITETVEALEHGKRVIKELAEKKG